MANFPPFLAGVPSLLLHSFPPVAPPLLVLFAASCALSRLIFRRRDSSMSASLGGGSVGDGDGDGDGDGNGNGGAVSSLPQPPSSSSSSTHQIFYVAMAILSFLACLSALDEKLSSSIGVASDGAFRNAGATFFSSCSYSAAAAAAAAAALPSPGDPKYESIRASLVENRRRSRWTWSRRRSERDTDLSNGAEAKIVKETDKNDEEEEEEEESGAGAAALVTGASSGIGRAISVELARRGAASSFVLVGRPSSGGSADSLETVASDLRDCYGVDVSVLRADLSVPGEARRVYDSTMAMIKTKNRRRDHNDNDNDNDNDNNVDVRYLVLSAGWGPTAPHVDLSDGRAWESVVRLNTESVAVLAGLYGKDMAETVAAAAAAVAINGQKGHANHERGSTNAGKAKTRTKSGSIRNAPPRILFVSSVAGMTPGIPGAALYAATKSFVLSLGRSLSLELAPYGVSVTTVNPGATLTDFASRSGMDDAALWNFPLGCVMTPEDVARSSVDAMLDGRMEYIPGVMNAFTMRVALPLLPLRLAMKFFRFCWQPWPFAFPPGWRKQRTKNGRSGKVHNDDAGNRGVAKMENERGSSRSLSSDEKGGKEEKDRGASSVDYGDVKSAGTKECLVRDDGDKVVNQISSTQMPTTMHPSNRRASGETHKVEDLP